MMLRVNGGYYSTSSLPLSLFGYTPLWINHKIGLYIYIQNTQNINDNVTLSLTNLINPEPYQM